MSYTVSLQQRLQQLKKAQANLPNVMSRAAKEATLKAVEVATAATPPKSGTGRVMGANTSSGSLKARWGEASTVEPQRTGNSYVTKLHNDLEYASYVNDGHRMDRHFVPGLYLDETTGQLAFDPQMADSRTGGIMVGTKTKYVKGEFMTDKARAAYEKTVLAVLDQEIRGLME